MPIPELPAPDPDGSRSVSASHPGTAGPATWSRFASLLPDIGYLLRDLARDDRVPWHAKAVAGAALVYVAPPTRLLVSHRLPFGPVGEVMLLLVAIRRLVSAAGYEVVRERWRGDDASFVWLLMLSGIDA